MIRRLVQRMKRIRFRRTAAPPEARSGTAPGGKPLTRGRSPVHWRYGLVLAFLAGVWPADSSAQDISLAASVNARAIGRLETVEYTLTLEGPDLDDVKTPLPPGAENLELVQQYPYTLRSVGLVDGAVQQKVVYKWSYRAIRPGTARIAGADVKIGGETYRAEPISITVTSQLQVRRPGSTQGPGGARSEPTGPGAYTFTERDLFIRAILGAEKVYVNGQVTIEYLLFFREGIRVRQSRLVDSWDTEGFWREDLDVDANPIPRVVVENGIRYQVIVLKRAAVFPTRAGDLHIDPLRIETEAYRVHRSNDPFDLFLNTPNDVETVRLASPPVTIAAVRPPAGAPEAFAGAVGSFRMETSLERSVGGAGGSAGLTVVIAGDGNLATLDAPSFTPADAVEVYDPQIRLSIDRTGERMHGAKRFTYVLVPRSNGAFDLPPVTFSYFDPVAARYETLVSDPGVLAVSASDLSPVAEETETGFPNDDIVGLMEGPARWIRSDPPPLYETWWPYAALLAPMLVFLGAVYYRRRAERWKTDPQYVRRQTVYVPAGKHLNRAESLLKQNAPRPFYEEVERAVLGFIGGRLDLAERGLTREQLEAALREAGVPEGEIKTLRALLDECDAARYAPGIPDPASMSAALQKTNAVILEIDRAVHERLTPSNHVRS